MITDKKIKYFQEVCKLTSDLSTCQEKQVGAVLVRNDRIMAIGYNGTAPGKKHCCEKKFITRIQHHKWSTRNELHAEQNLISHCAKEGIKTDQATLYVSLSPCIHCAKLIKASGITKVIFLTLYDLDFDGVKFLSENKIKVYNFDLMRQ